MLNTECITVLVKTKEESKDKTISLNKQKKYHVNDTIDDKIVTSMIVVQCSKGKVRSYNQIQTE